MLQHYIPLLLCVYAYERVKKKKCEYGMKERVRSVHICEMCKKKTLEKSHYLHN